MRYELFKRYCITIYYLKLKQILYRIKYLIYRPEIPSSKSIKKIKLRAQKQNLKFLKIFKIVLF